MPLVPAMREDRRHNGNNLYDRLQLPQIARLDGETLGGGNRAQAADQELPADDEDGNPGLDDVRVVLDERDVGGRNEQLVGKRIEQHAHRCDLSAAAGEGGIDSIRDGNQDQEQRGDNLLLAMPAAMRKMRREHPDEDGHREDPDHRDGVGQIHELRSAGSKDSGAHITLRPYGHYAPARMAFGLAEPVRSKWILRIRVCVQPAFKTMDPLLAWRRLLSLSISHLARVTAVKIRTAFFCVLILSVNQFME